MLQTKQMLCRASILEGSGPSKCFSGSPHLEAAHERLIYAHHCPCIVELPAVVGRRENGNQLPLGKELIAIFHYLQQGRCRLLSGLHLRGGIAQ